MNLLKKMFVFFYNNNYSHINKLLCFSFFIILLSPRSLKTQELNCNVQVYAPQIQGSDRSIFENMQKTIYEFMNNKKWTNYSYKQQEKIECSILITINDQPGTNQFKGTIQIQSRRPIFNTSYNSPLFNYVDKDFEFQFIEYQPLEFVENSFTSNLTSVLAYYAYIIIGLDFDSYKLYGGAQFYDKAQSIVNTAQNTSEKGWKTYENKKNRYWLVENLLNKSYSGIHECLYNYHRLGLDQMYDQKEISRNYITTALESLRNVNREKPGLHFINIFMTTKSDEIINIYSDASTLDKNKIVPILKEIDPSNSAKYNKIIAQQ